MSRILLTGATGFIGSYVVSYLLARGYDVAIIIRPQSNPWRINDVLSRLHVIYGDLNDQYSFVNNVRSFAPEITIHLAWYGVGNRFRNDPYQINNIQASLNLLEAVHSVGCRSWIGLGSQAEYGIYNQVINEEMPANPVTIYGITKLCTCLLTQGLCNLYGMRFIWLRLFSTYGPKDDHNWMIPYVILTLLRRERPALTAGKQRWDYLFVEDVAEAIYHVMTNSNAKGIFNLGSGKSYTVRSIVERIRDLIDPSLPLVFGEIPYQADQIMHLQADITRLQKTTGWKPNTNLDEGLKRTVEWYRKMSQI